MLYALDRSQLKRLRRREPVYEFRGAEMLMASFLTDPETVRAMLPKPLEPSDEPDAMAFIARYPNTNFGISYNEGALFLQAVYRDEPGWYCLAMPVDNDMALIGGREQFGYPKKMAEEISLERSGEHVMGSVVRRGVEILHIEAELTGRANLALLDKIGPAVDDLEGRPCRKIVSFLFKYSRSPGGRGFDFIPRLLREPSLFRPRDDLMSATGTLTLGTSPHDPLGDLPVRDVMGIIYGTWDNDMLPARVVARVRNPLAFARYAMFKEDFAGWFLDNGEASPSPTGRERSRRRKTMRAY